jgi:hypothetical protein
MNTELPMPATPPRADEPAHPAGDRALDDREVMQQALDALNLITRQFTRTPSSLKDSTARVEAHRVMGVLVKALSREASAPGPSSPSSPSSSQDPDYSMSGGGWSSIMKIIDHGMAGRTDAVRSYVELLANQMDGISPKRSEALRRRLSGGDEPRVYPASAGLDTTVHTHEEEALRRIGQLVRDQDNRATDAPIFIVEQKRRIYGLSSDYSDDHVWIDSDGEADPETARELNEAYHSTGQEPAGWSRTGYADRWEFVTACFTEEGCRQYLAANGHNLKEPRIFADSSFRNQEFRLVREHLISVAQGHVRVISGDRDASSDADGEPLSEDISDEPDSEPRAKARHPGARR